MHIVLWDTRRNDVSKDFAGGMGVGMYPAFTGSWKSRIIRRMYTRDRRPVALNFAYLAAIFKQLGHTVEYSEDNLVASADVYVFNPALLTLDMEQRAIDRVLAANPHVRVLVIGQVAYAMPEVFERERVTVVRGEPEQMLWKLDEVLSSDEPVVNVGSVKDLDALPWPDWTPFDPSQFKISYDFWKFPTGLIQASRGCTLSCNYCPYIMVENKTRVRDPERVIAELEHAQQTWGFRSFKFRDPLFGTDKKKVARLAEGLGKLKKRVQFSIESRLDLLKPEILKMLKEVGLTSITVGIETPDETTLRKYKRAPIKDDKQREFVATCQKLGIRTVAGFMIGFPEDTAESIKNVQRYAAKVNPTYANFNVVTPYPGTEFFEQVKHQIDDFDYSKYSVYTPVMKYENLTREQVSKLHAWCFEKYYFRAKYLRGNAHLLWPILQKLGLGRSQVEAETPSTKPAPGDHATPPAPKHLLPIVTDRDRQDASVGTEFEV